MKIWYPLREPGMYLLTTPCRPVAPVLIQVATVTGYGSRAGAWGTATESSTPSNERPWPIGPAVRTGPPMSVPSNPFPDESAARAPPVSEKVQKARGRPLCFPPPDESARDVKVKSAETARFPEASRDFTR